MQIELLPQITYLCLPGKKKIKNFYIRISEGADSNTCQKGEKFNKNNKRRQVKV